MDAEVRHRRPFGLHHHGVSTLAVTAKVTDSTGQVGTGTLSLTITDPTPPVALGHWRNRAGDTGLAWRQRFDAAEAQFGPFAGHWRDYLGPGSNGQPSAAHKQALLDGRRIFFNWKPWLSGQSWATVGNGSRNTVITAAAQAWQAAIDAAVAAGWPRAGMVWLAPGHEPENDEGAAGSGMTPADWIAMQRQVASIFAAQAPDVRIVWVCMGFEPTNSARFWPGADAVHYVGLDPYERAPDPAWQMAERIISRSTTLRQILPGAAAMPVVIAEWGPDLGGDMNPYPTGDRGTDQHRADAITGVRTRLAEVTAAGVVELDYFDARTDGLTDTGPDALAYLALKTATES